MCGSRCALGFRAHQHANNHDGTVSCGSVRGGNVRGGGWGVGSGGGEGGEGVVVVGLPQVT